MGSNNAKASEKLSKENYPKTPDIRLKTRYENFEYTLPAVSEDASIDKVSYNCRIFKAMNFCDYMFKLISFVTM